jgi:predicted Zn-dependent protease
LDRLARLAQVTGAWGWTTERTDILRQIIAEFPQEKWASESLVAELYALGNTRELEGLVSKLYASDPSNVRLKNNLANLLLLLKKDSSKAFRLAQEVYQSAPDNPFYAATYAYSLSLQGQAEQAVGVFTNINAEKLQIPAVAAYYGTVQVRAGHKEIAKEPLHRAEAATILLPEEKEMIRVAKAML